MAGHKDRLLAPLPGQVTYFPAGRNIAFHAPRLMSSNKEDYKQAHSLTSSAPMGEGRNVQLMPLRHRVLMLKTVCVLKGKPDFLSHNEMSPSTPPSTSGVNCTFQGLS